MFAYDVNGDGKADVISSSAHNYGIWWCEQKPGKDGNPVFVQHDLFPTLVLGIARPAPASTSTATASRTWSPASAGGRTARRATSSPTPRPCSTGSRPSASKDGIDDVHAARDRRRFRHRHAVRRRRCQRRRPARHRHRQQEGRVPVRAGAEVYQVNSRPTARPCAQKSVVLNSGAGRAGPTPPGPPPKAGTRLGLI